MRSAAQGDQAGCGLAKKQATKGLFFGSITRYRSMITLRGARPDHDPNRLPSAIAIVVTMDNHCSAFAENRRCRTSYRRCDVAAVGARDGGEGKSPRHGFWKGSTVGGGSLSRRTWLFPLHVLFFVVRSVEVAGASPPSLLARKSHACAAVVSRRRCRPSCSACASFCPAIAKHGPM